jgi:hypothetical protein
LIILFIEIARFIVSRFQIAYLTDVHTKGKEVRRAEWYAHILALEHPTEMKHKSYCAGPTDFSADPALKKAAVGAVKH